MSRLSDVNAFIELSRGCASADDLRGLMESITCEMGFHHYALFRQVRCFSWDNKRLLAISNYPRPWLEYFFEQRLIVDDPVTRASCLRGAGFRFDDIPSLITVTDRHRQVMEAAEREGLADGFCVPGHIPQETAGSCTFVVRERGALPEANLAMAQLVGAFAYEAARRIQRSGQNILKDGVGGRNPHDSRRTMTTRQLECLTLVARGKSDWEISRILGIGQETVKHHIRAVRERYDVGTRIQAAISAISDGELNIHDLVS